MRISDGELKKLLTDSGKVTAAALKEAEAQSGQSKDSLMAEVLKRKLISEKDLTQIYAKSLDLPFIELTAVKIPREVLLKIPERIARKYQTVLFGIDGSKLQLAMSDPEDFQAADFIEKQVGSDVKIYVATTGDIAGALDQYKGNLDSEITKAIKDSSAEEEKTQEVSAKDLTEDAPIAKTVNIVLEYALRSGASDVHIEPHENLVQVRYRIDGVLRETMTLPKNILAAVVSRIKILANLKIDEHRVPQDGRFKFTLGSKTVALRVSTLPVMDGEKVVMRLLDESTRAMTLEELGLEGTGLQTIKKALSRPHGMTLVTGPTGSGKSTTLYSILSLMNTPGVNISTVEDPVEYRISGVNQTQVNPKAGMTFATGLRALLRQDPNIIMVGEIRDGETADLAVQAALTGHTVLSTLHTNNAATTLPRLLDMGVEPFLIASTVNCIIAQRLVRRVCQSCRVAYAPQGEEMTSLRRDFQVDAAVKFLQGNPSIPGETTVEEPKKEEGRLVGSGHKKQKIIPAPAGIDVNKSILEKIASDPNIINRSSEQAIAQTRPVEQSSAAPAQTLQPATPLDPKNIKEGEMVLYRAGGGCTECGTSGYRGRMGIHEVLEVDETIAKMITGHATSEEIQLTAVRDGMLTMQQDGFVKALRGLTTVEEILRVTRE
jgi:type IV pilus assembly protein PilB